MKRILFPALLICALVCSDHAGAAAVGAQAAQVVALNFIKGNAPFLGVNTATLCYTRTETDGTVDYYVFDLSPAKGFVIISADDNILPVIGYSAESNFRLSPKYTGLKSWMDRTASIVHHGIVQQAPANAYISGLWTAYRQGPYAPVTRGTSAGPLCTTMWDQENDTATPPPYLYNLFCPFNSTDNQRCLTGCVATAMAQIMKYWNFPAQGTGSFTYIDDTIYGYSYEYGTQSADFAAHAYQWNLMPARLVGTESPAADSAVDQLMYDCAVSVGMDFGDDNQNGSGANGLTEEEWVSAHDSLCSQTAFVKYFSYDPNTIQGVFDSSYTPAAWNTLIENELTNGRPVLYEGNDSSQGGHAWVCDGFDPGDMLHMNWGWGGSDNGYFAITNFTTSGNYDPVLQQDALIGIEPYYPAGIGRLTDARNISIHPNPSQNLVQITINSPTAENCLLTIYNVLGEEQVSKNIHLSGGNRFSLDVSGFAPGLYVISLQGSDGTVTGRFVKE